MMTKLAELALDIEAAAPERFRPKVRGRGWPVALIGLVLVLGGAFGAWAWANSTAPDGARPVLVTAASLPAGHVLTQADLAEVEVDAEGLSSIEAGRAGEVLGQTLALPVAAGTVLTPSMVGPAATPEPGRATTTLALPDGSFPAELEPGQTVILMAGPGAETSTATPWQMPAVVRSVADLDGSALIGLEFNAADRAGLATARGTEPFLLAWTADLPAEGGE
jgi:hypothetical protein